MFWCSVTVGRRCSFDNSLAQTTGERVQIEGGEREMLRRARRFVLIVQMVPVPVSVCPGPDSSSYVWSGWKLIFGRIFRIEARRFHPFFGAKDEQCKRCL